MKAVSKFVFVVATAIFPVIASASVEALSFSCSSSLVVSVENGYQASCDGDFSFNSGVLEDDAAIVLRAAGMLTIGHQVLLKSPSITLDADSVEFFGAANISVPQLLLPVIEPAQAIFPRSSLTLIGEFHPILEVNSGAILTTGNNVFLGRIRDGSHQQLSGNISPSQGGTLVLSNASGVIVPLSASGITFNPIAITSVPEPSNSAMLVIGLFCVGLAVCRKAKQY